jgi:heme o synthase
VTTPSPVETTLPVTDLRHGWLKVFSELFKARLTLLVLLTTLMGFFLGSPDGVSGWLCVHALGGTSLLAAGAAALNQWIEREHDALMRRTASRPIPSGRMDTTVVLALGVGTSVAGLVWLAVWVNLLTAFLGAITLATYLFLYTPLKRITVLNTLVGAIPGALPPLMGWTAATGSLSPKGWALFAILFFWQLPHFMAIAWIYRDEYSKAGFRMLSGIDPDGRRSAASAIRNTIALILVSLVPFLQGVSGRIYLSTALILGGLFLVHAVRFAILLDIPSARRLFFSSILYLPVLLTFLVIDRTKEVPSPTSFPPSTSTFSVPLPTAVVLNFAAPPVSECGS